MTVISGSTRVYQILGDPIDQARAPEIFNHLFRRHGVDAVLVPARVSAADLASYVHHAFKARNVDGLWLTIPHKTAMVPLLDRCDALGRLAGAVNAARRGGDGAVEGALFDGVGFMRGLAHFGLSVAGRRVLVVGAGGAGVAIAASLVGHGPACLALFDAEPGRAAAVADRLAAACAAPVVAAGSADPAGYELVVNATPLGLQADDALPFDVNRLEPRATVVDILMKNRPTPLLAAVRARGLVGHSGHEMLLQQVPDYLSFFGHAEIARSVQADPSEVRKLLLQD